MNNKSSFGRHLCLLALVIGFTWLGGAVSFGQTVAAVNTALGDLYPTISSSNSTTHVVTVTFTQPTVATASATELENAIELISAPTGTTVSVTGHSSHVGLNDPSDAVTDIGVVLQNISGSVPSGSYATDAGDLLSGFWSGVRNSSSPTAYLGAAAAAAANFSNFPSSLPESTVDTAEATLVGDAITDAGSDLTDILVKALAVTDPNSVQQATLIAGKATSAALSTAGTNLDALGAAIFTNDGGDITNAGQFLETMVVKETTAATQEAFIQGYTSTESQSQLATTATNVVQAAGTAFTAAQLESVFTGLVASGTASLLSESSIIPGIVTGVLSNTNITVTDSDAAKATLTNDLITPVTVSYAGTIAAAGITTLANPAADAGAFTDTIAGNTNIKSSPTTVGSVIASMASEFPLGDITANSTNLGIQASIVDGALKANSTQAAVYVPAVAAAVLASGSGATAETTFASDFITAIDSKTNIGYPAITDVVRSQAALALAKQFNGFAGAAAAITGAAVLTDASTPTTINNIAEPILAYFAVNSGTEAGSIAATIAKTPGSVGSNTYSPAYLASQLIQGAKVGTAPNATVVDDIAFGVATDSSVITTYGSKDSFVNALAGQLSATPALPYLKDAVAYLAAQTGFTPVGVMTDISTTGGAPVESATLAAVIASTEPSGDAPAIAYAAANGSGIQTDAVRDTISVDVVQNVPGSDVAISGSVGTLIAPADKAAFAEAVAKEAVAKGETADVYEIALNVANSIGYSATPDLADLKAITVDSIAAFPTVSKTVANVSQVVDNVIGNYSGSLSGTPGTLNYASAATLAGYVVSAESAVAGLGNAVVTNLIPVEATNEAAVGPAAADFTLAIPLSGTTIAVVSTTLDKTYGYADVGAITSGILSHLAATSIPLIAQTVVKTINNTGTVTAPLATTVADAAVAVPGALLSEIETTATDVILAVPSGIQQATANTVALGLSSQLITTVANAHATAATLATDQEDLAEAIVPISGLAPDQVVANVAVYAASDATIGTIAVDALNKYDTATSTTPTAASVSTFADSLTTDLTAAPPSVDGGFGYTNAASMAKALVAGLPSTISGGLPAASNAVANGLVLQEVSVTGSSAGTSALIANSFATALPADAIAIVGAATKTSLYANLTPEQSGTIAASVGSIVNTLITPAVTGTLAQIAATAAVPQQGQTFDDSLVSIASIFASKVPASSFYAVSVDLSGTLAGTLAQNIHDSAAPVIAAQFITVLGQSSANNATLLPAFLKAMATNCYVNAADILGAYIDLAASLNLASTANNDAITTAETALVTAVKGDITAQSAALTNLSQLPGPLNGLSGTAETNEITTLLDEAVVDANKGEYVNFGSISTVETPIVNM